MDKVGEDMSINVYFGILTNTGHLWIFMNTFLCFWHIILIFLICF